MTSDTSATQSVARVCSHVGRGNKDVVTDAAPTPSGPFAIGNLHFAICSAFLLLLCGILFFHRLADRDLWNSHEGRAAQDAQSVLDGDWALPRQFDGQPEMQKPPLYYWLVAGVARLGGGQVDAWAVRLPAAASALVCVLAIFLWGWRRGRPVAGFVAAVILATAVHFTWLARVGRIDMPLTLTVCLTLLAFAAARTWYRVALAYALIAVGIMLKGPIALALSAAALAVYLAVEKQLPAPWRWRSYASLGHRLGLWWGLPLVAVLVLPWFLWANARTGGEWFESFVWRHNIERGFGGGPDGEGHWNHPWWLYGPLFAWDFLPWSVFLVPAAWYFVRRQGWRVDREARFGLAWCASMIVLLSCMRFKRSDYLLPAYPGAAIFLGCIAERWYKRFVLAYNARRLNPITVGFGWIVTGCIAFWLLNVDWYIPRLETTREYTRFAQEIRDYSPPGEPVVFFRTEAHALVFHVGRPIEVFVEWERLDAWAARSRSAYVVMPARVAEEWPRHLKAGQLEEISRNSPADGRPHEKPFVLLRSRPSD